VNTAPTTFFAAALATLLVLPITASADTLQLPQHGDGNAAVPSRGMSMSTVERRFGSPQRKLPAVGEPPITRWVYGDYKVFFEHQFVIHSVRTGTP